MLSTAKNLSTVGIILGIIDLFFSLPLLMYLRDLNNMSWAYYFSACIVLLAGAAALLLISCALRSAAQEMQMNDETYMSRIIDLKKRVDELEHKVKL